MPAHANVSVQASAFAPGEPRWLYFLDWRTSPQPDSRRDEFPFDRAVRLFPESQSAPRLRLADTLLGLGRSDEAEAHSASGDSEPIRRQRLWGWAKWPRLAIARTEAVDFLSAAIRDPSTRRAAHRLLVTLNQRLGRTNEAHQLARALAELPNDKPDDAFLSEIAALKTESKHGSISRMSG